MLNLSSPILVSAHYPTLKAIAEVLYPWLSPKKISIDSYETALAKSGKLTPFIQEAIDRAREFITNSDVVIYIAGPLTGVEEEAKQRYVIVKELFESLGINGNNKYKIRGYVPHLYTDPIKHPNVTSDEVRMVDFLWNTLVADFQINFTFPVTHGGAIELSWSELSMNPSTFLTPLNQKLSRLTEGMGNVFSIIRYEDFKNCFNSILDFANEICAFRRVLPSRDVRELYWYTLPEIRKSILQHLLLNPAEYQPIFEVSNYCYYFNNPESEYYGLVGSLVADDHNSGNYMILLENGVALWIPYKKVADIAKLWTVAKQPDIFISLQTKSVVSLANENFVA